jgi:mRNA interferase MazF
MHDFLRTVIIAPMTTKGRQAPYRVPITHDGKKGLVLLDQIRTIDKGRLVKRLGAVSNKTLGASLNILQGAFTL